jgi:CRISPR/Cas system endoribonuclease Cas6 (RAMP superfamily)
MISEETKTMVLEHVDEHLYFVEVGKKVDYTQLFDKHLLQATTPLEHRYVFERALAYLMSIEEIDLVYAGVNNKGQTLYKRTA